MSSPKHAVAAEEAWARRKTWNLTWARNDTDRWLDERAADASRWVRALGIKLRRDPRMMGLWMRSHLPGNFDVVHSKLATMTHEERSQTTAFDVLPANARAAVDSEPPFVKHA